MNSEHGAYLKMLRESRGLSREKLAHGAGIAVRTLANWEMGIHSPGTPEWQSIMRAMDATPQERGESALLLKTPRGVQLARQETRAANGALTAIVGPLPDMGDLLRALRLRKRWTQGQVAEWMGVARATVNRWEMTRNLPSDETIDRLSRLLDAHPEERQALLRRRLEPPHWSAELSWNAVLENIEILNSYGSSSPLYELMIIALKRQLHLHLGRTQDAALQLAYVETYHASFLFYHERNVEAQVLAQRSLALIGERFPADPIQFGVLNLIAVLERAATGNSDANLKRYARWIPRLPNVYRIAPLCDMSLCVAGQQRFTEMEVLLTQARRILETDRAAMPYHHEYYGITYASLLRKAGKPIEAMDYLPPIDIVENTPRARLMTWADYLIEAGDRQTATRYLNVAARQLAEAPNPRAQREWNCLTRRL